jgi:RimJ/RimL family protein N-acetyltransferase
MSERHLKIAQLSNYEEFYAIRSEPNNLFWTGYDQAPDFESFKSWYANRLEDPNRRIYLLWEEDKCLGALNIDLYKGHAFIGYSIITNLQGQGLATFMVQQSEAIIAEIKSINEVKAWINFQNVGSIKVCEKNGFYKSETTETRNRFGKEELYYLMIKNM